MKIPCRLHEAEEIVSEMDLCRVPDDIVESDEDYQIVISGWWVYLPELGICLREGVLCNYDEEEKAYLPDFSITVIMDADTKMQEDGWLCYERDGFEITLANYYGGKFSMAAVSELPCVICIPDNEPETE